MNNRTIAHEWANQTRESRRGSNFYFDGPALYSYGAHFIVGRIVIRAGNKCALMNSKRYGSSTSRHQSFACVAASHLTQFHVPNVGTDVLDIGLNYGYYLSCITEARTALLNARAKHIWREQYLNNRIVEAARYIEFFPGRGVLRGQAAARRKILAFNAARLGGTLISEAERAALNKKIERAAELEKSKSARRIAAYAEQAQKNLDRLNEWTNGGTERPIGDYGPGGIELPVRLRIKGPAVETSQGAVVSCRAARIVWAAVKAGRDIIGMEIDGYTVTAFNGVLKIGCHTIERSEVDRIGALLDITEGKKE